MNVNKCSRKIPGFTLVELMIVIAIVAILVALAVPSYDRFIKKGRRADAQEALIGFAGDAERIYTATNSYATVTLPANTTFYTFTFPAAATATAYTIRATPTSVQNSDGCGTMNLNQVGQRTHTGSEANCW